MSMDLHTIGNQYNTNKTWHNYCRFYDRILSPIRETCERMLEIGIDQGSSLRMWRDYFHNATVFGVDYNPATLLREEDRITCAQADQSNPVQLYNIVSTWGSFDFIIDDGSHIVSHQKNSIEYLWKCLKPKGVYIIEDLHTNIPELFNTHPHLHPSIIGKFVDKQPTVHSDIFTTMAGRRAFSFHHEIEDIYYFANVSTNSLSCVFIKK